MVILQIIRQSLTSENILSGSDHSDNYAASSRTYLGLSLVSHHININGSCISLLVVCFAHYIKEISQNFLFFGGVGDQQSCQTQTMIFFIYLFFSVGKKILQWQYFDLIKAASLQCFESKRGIDAL